MSKDQKSINMVSSVEVVKLDLSSVSNHALQGICGCFDENLKFIEQECNVDIHRKGNCFFIQGVNQQVQKVTQYIQALARKSHYQEIDLKLVRELVLKDSSSKFSTPGCIPRHGSQEEYIQKIKKNTITFGIGPAGTGKTYLAVAEAVTAFEQGQVQKIILTRPAVEAGEHLGFLPGDLQQKVDPYLRPLFDALHEFMGFETVTKLLARQVIEVAPLAFMRGRTLARSFVILDEAQNTTTVQMKLFLTRLGSGSKMVITGDTSQIDLQSPRHSGLAHILNFLKDIPDIGFHLFDKKDVVRHPLVTRIIDAYEQQESQSDK
jgi:phosphate starvation-inducible PhoH-like protein